MRLRIKHDDSDGYETVENVEYFEVHSDGGLYCEYGNDDSTTYENADIGGGWD